MTRRLLFSLCCLNLLSAAPRQSRAVILVTLDGLRWQEIFNGIDARLMNEKTAGMTEQSAPALRDQLSRETPKARREALLPFFWKELAPQGIVLGNVAETAPCVLPTPQRDIAPTMLELLGVPAASYPGVQRHAIDIAIK